jgi:hypothetical protein
MAIKLTKNQKAEIRDLDFGDEQAPGWALPPGTTRARLHLLNELLIEAIEASETQGEVIQRVSEFLSELEADEDSLVNLKSMVARFCGSLPA